MMELLQLLMLVIVVVVPSYFLYQWVVAPPGSLWHDRYVAKWFSENSYCPECGSAMAWMPENVVRYEESSGQAYRQGVWACSRTPTHTHNRLVDWCSRKEYFDGSAP